MDTRFKPALFTRSIDKEYNIEKDNERVEYERAPRLRLSLQVRQRGQTEWIVLRVKVCEAVDYAKVYSKMLKDRDEAHWSGVYFDPQFKIKYERVMRRGSTLFVDSDGWYRPKDNTIARAVYDLMKVGMSGRQIAAHLNTGLPSVAVQMSRIRNGYSPKHNRMRRRIRWLKDEDVTSSYVGIKSPEPRPDLKNEEWVTTPDGRYKYLLIKGGKSAK